MKAFPIELRERIVAEVDRNQRTIAKIAEVFQVSERTIYNLLALRSATGSVAPRPHGGGAVAKIDASIREDLRTLIKENPDATLEELQQMVRTRHKISVGITTIWKAIRRIRISVKKRPGVHKRPTRKSARSSRGNSRDSLPLASSSSMNMAST